jgi:serine/threonine-protein kinase
MGTVYLGYRCDTGELAQPVALKVIHSNLAKDPDFVSMFLDEARIASRIDHRNVCRVLDFGEADHTYYLALEYLFGESWADVLSARERSHGLVRIPPTLVAHVVAEACLGLHAAHMTLDARAIPLHIVHRDVSPQNLHIAYDGSVRVIDFGVAKAIDRVHHTRQGVIKGRFAYMAPEQMLGDPVDRRADIWSLGVVLRESASGRKLFRGKSDAANMHAVLIQPMPPWPDHVPEELRAIADRALQRDPAARYQSAREMALDLQRFLQASAPPSRSAELARFMRTLFAERHREGRRLLEETAAECRTMSGRCSAARDLDETDEPTRIWSAELPRQDEVHMSSDPPLNRAAAPSCTDADERPLLVAESGAVDRNRIAPRASQSIEVAALRWSHSMHRAWLWAAALGCAALAAVVVATTSPTSAITSTAIAAGSAAAPLSPIASARAPSDEASIAADMAQPRPSNGATAQASEESDGAALPATRPARVVAKARLPARRRTFVLTPR